MSLLTSAINVTLRRAAGLLPTRALTMSGTVPTVIPAQLRAAAGRPPTPPPAAPPAPPTEDANAAAMPPPPPPPPASDAVAVTVAASPPSSPPPRDAAATRDPMALDDYAPRGGPMVTRVWQPTPAPDASAVGSIMLAPLTPPKEKTRAAMHGGAGTAAAAASNPRRDRALAGAGDDDGLIVRRRPAARADNLARRVQRAEAEKNDARWFDERDGGIRCAADPIPPGGERSRPARWFDPDAPYLQTIPAVDHLAGLDGAAAMASSLGGGAKDDDAYRLEVSVGRLEFACHPLMGKEDFLAAQLEETFRAYKRRELSGLARLYDTKSHAARARAKALRREMDGGVALFLSGASPAERLKAMEEEAEEALQLALDEGEKARAAVKHMIDLHVAIEEARRAMGSRATSVRLVTRPKPGSDPAHIAAGTAELEPILTGGPPRDEGANVLRAEQNRRSRAASARFSVALEINGKTVPGWSQPVSLSSNGAFSTTIAHAFSVTVSKWPESVRLVLYEKGTVMDTKIAAVPVALPGAELDAPTADPHAKQYQFSAESPFNPAWNNTAAGAIPIGDAAADTGAKFTSGSLFITCAWVPRETHGFGGAAAAAAAAAARDDDVEKRARIAPPPPTRATMKKQRAAHALQGAGVDFRASIDGGEGGLKAALDPSNPEDAALLETMETKDALKHQTGGGAVNGGFRLASVDDQMLGYTSKASKRQQLLKLRAEQGVPLMDGGVPLEDVNIPDHLLDKTAEEFAGDKIMGAQMAGLAEADRRASKIADHLHRIRLNLKRANRNAKAGIKGTKGPARTEDVVKDTPLPILAFNMENIARVFSFLKPRRKLRPTRRRARAEESHPEYCEVVINIQKAFNLPVRSGGGGGGGRGMNRGGGYGDDRGGFGAGFGGELQPYIEVTFQNYTTRTRVASGSSPSWQESISLPFRPPGGDFSPAGLVNMSDAIEITLFDEVHEEPERSYGAASRTRNGGSETTSTTRHFLGKINVSVASLYRAGDGKVEGVLPFEQPRALIGYDTPPPVANATGRGGVPGAGGLSPQIRASLGVYIQFAPALAKPDPGPSDAGQGEEDALLRHGQKWEMDARGANKSCKHRPYVSAVTNAQGRSCLLPRYVAPAALPPGFQGAVADEPTLRQLLRFVHLVPHVSDMEAFETPANVDIWTTSAEFLDLCAGDSEEHALLLVGYLLTLGVEAYIVLGVSAADANAAMVFTPGGQGRAAQNMTRHGGRNGDPNAYAPMLEDALMWDPFSGEVYSVYDSSCSACMGEIAVVFNADNIWANVQPRARPHEMHWNLNDSAHWKPYFSVTGFAPRSLPTCQKTIAYQSYEPAFYERIASAVEREAMDAVVRIRSRQHTPFNRRVSRQLKEMLRDIEGHVLMSPDEAAMGISLGGGKGRVGTLTELHVNELGNMLDGYTVTGCPINLRFVDAAEVRNAIEETAIADTSRSDVEFAVATHVEPYGATFVCSVWIYVARLTKNSRY